MTSNQLAALIRTRKRDAIHAHRMEHDAAYRERIERGYREYDAYCEQQRKIEEEDAAREAFDNGQFGVGA